MAEKGVEVAINGHICHDPANISENKLTYMVHWEKVTSDERQDYKPLGAYSFYFKTILMEQGSYTISDLGLLEVGTNRKNYVAKIEELTNISLILKQGDNYFKYQKLD